MTFLRALACLLLLALPLFGGAEALPRIDRLESALALTPAQREQLETAQAATKRLGVAMALRALEAKERLKEEMRKPRPDFGLIVESGEAILAETRELRREAREEWQKLYAMLDDDQVATLKRYFGDRLEGLESLREFLRGRQGGWT